MKFMLFATSALAATTFQKRQLSVVEDAISAISSATTTLREGINAFQAIGDAGDLQDAADAVVQAINDGNSAVSAIEPLGNEAASLATPIQDLASLVQGTVDDLVAKKQTFVDVGVGGVVLTAATTLRDAAATFQTTVLSKVPDQLQGLGQELAQPITDALNQAVQEFSDQEGSTGGGSSSTTGGSDDTTTSAPTESTTGGSTYPTGATTTTGGSGASYTTTSAVATFTGAAIANAANGYGAMAMAVLAGAAML